MVFVNDAAEYAVASDGPVDWHGDWSVVVVGCAWVSGLVGSMSVVMLCVGGQDFGYVSLVVDQDAGGAHEPLGVTARSRGPRLRFDDRDVLAVEHGVEGWSH
jgi:hypothetical protein